MGARLNLQRLVVEQPIQSEPFLIVTRLHSCMIFVFMAQFIPPNPTQFAFFLAYCQNPCHDFPFSLKKRKEKVKVSLSGYFNDDCLFTGTTTVPARAD